MSATLALIIAAITLGSCIASYHLGRESVLEKFRSLQERKRRWQEWDEEDDYE